MSRQEEQVCLTQKSRRPITLFTQEPDKKTFITCDFTAQISVLLFDTRNLKYWPAISIRGGGLFPADPP